MITATTASTVHTNALVLAAAVATRTAFVAIVVIGGLRLSGKRELGQMNVYDLAMIMAIANGVQNAMTQGSGYLTAGLASAGSLLVLGALLAAIFLRFPRLERDLVGSPELLVFDGALIPERLRAARVSAAEVMAAVREHGFDTLNDVLSATLEVNGSISVIARTASHRKHHRALAPGKQPKRSGPGEP